MQSTAPAHRFYPRLTILAALVGSLFQATAIAAPAADATLAPVEVVGTTPLPGIALPKNQIPAAVQTASPRQLEQSQALDLGDYMNRNLGSVHVNQMQGNPYQADVNYRGYTASPLLGTPQGLSVYMDGVRLNQPFGDVVSWDLIPRSAIKSMTLMPGSNPLFGLNTLGGALSVHTKDGLSNPGTAVQLTAGSWGRWQTELEHGGSNDKGLHWYVSTNLFGEEGWRDSSPSRVNQLFSKVGWADARTDVTLTMALANNKLTGNGLQEQRLLDNAYGSVYTKPDETRNESIFVNLAAQHAVNDNLLLSGNTYYRKIRTRTLNGDINEGSLDQSVYQPSAAEQTALTNAGYVGFPTSGANAGNTPFPFWRCIANVLLNDEPGEKCNGLINRSWTEQENYGVTGQVTIFSAIAGRKNQFTGGAGYDESRIKFRQTTQLGYLNPDRSVTGLPAYADGVSGGVIDGEPFDNRVDIVGRTRTASIYATDTLSLNDFWHVTLAGRYNRTMVHNRDHITPGGGSGSLDGDHTFSRFNPAAGITFTPTAAVNAYAGYNEGSRTPTAMELGCADPANPCKMPNAMAGDPPLKQVVTKTWEAGLRGSLGSKAHWNAGVFRSDNYDDLMFVADNAAGFGYFKNFGKTRREGVELGADAQMGRFDLAINYTFLDATYRSAEIVGGAANSSNDTGGGLDGNIQIRPGDHIPLVPRHIIKARADWNINATASLGLGVTGVSGAYARGNENNQHQADGTYYLGSGRSAGYAIFDLYGKYRASEQLSFFAQVNNLFDRKYATAAQLGATAFGPNGGFVARPFPSVGAPAQYPLVHATFYAPGAPRAVFVGMRYEFDKLGGGK